MYGYICKACGGPSPVGVGYVAQGKPAAEASAARWKCDCGYSVKAGVR